jgi:Sec-independent protein translocase protein TatA
MDFLGIGPLELACIFLIILIIFGPDDIEKTGRNIGRLLRNLTHSAEWRTLQQASREIRDLPNRLIREAELERIKEEAEELQEATEAKLNAKQRSKPEASIDAWTRKPKPEFPEEGDEG